MQAFLAALVAMDDIPGCDRDKFTVIGPYGRCKLLLERIPSLSTSLQVATDQCANVFAGVLKKAVVANLLLDVVLQRTADLHMNAT
ncbi:hypothetical protein EV286_11781 [Rhizobium sp. BK251]|nr:hypothetical protein [Rhizobium sp. BK251]TCL63267.1 hypothetical protein EV286_11781 [Rhizobium sp. BK251]